MRFVQFSLRNQASVHLGVELGEGGDVIDLVQLPVKTALDLVRGGPELLEQVKRLISDNPKFRIPRCEVTLSAPIDGMDKVLCIGMNYKDHCEEQNAPVPTEPLVFNKFPSCVVGPFADIPYPEVTEQLDWEVELVIVIGKEGKDISEADAMDHVFGFTVAHDVSARDWQLKKNGGQWLLGKSMDAFCPIGPAIVTKDEVEDPHNLRLQCLVNGISKQDSNTNQLVFGTQALVSWVSKFCTIKPGDIILTGTPPGVGIFKNPPEFLQKGDVVECVIEKIGSIKNRIV